jgi:peptide/nickel transport system substrate-binding protein
MSLFSFKLPSKRLKVEYIFETFSKPKWIIFFISILVFVITAFSLLFALNKKLLVGVPAHGGWDVEGVVGTPRFINPLLALSDADKDLTALVYSGLMRRDGNGNLIPDLAESYEISDDGLTYTFVIRESGCRFHRGASIQNTQEQLSLCPRLKEQAMD